ncbi:MAG: hypothetical protein NTW31_12460 [Bacteroidetes bacterium]|nr:hypothetical protein [Bacteroidota bacterium]
MENLLSEKESLDLIGQMISTAKNNLQKGTGKIFLLWGYMVAIISLLTFILLITLPPETKYYAYYMWFLMFAAYPVHYVLLKNKEKEKLVMTYIEKVMNWVWIAFSISILVVVAGLIIAMVLVMPAFTDVRPGHEFDRWFQWLFITPLLLCLYGFALFVSGKAYAFKPLATGGVICWIATFIILISIHHVHVLAIQQIVLTISAVAGFVIPGHMLNRKECKDV